MGMSDLGAFLRPSPTMTHNTEFVWCISGNCTSTTYDAVAGQKRTDVQTNRLWSGAGKIFHAPMTKPPLHHSAYQLICIFMFTG